ncbi:hypothetical protein [Glaciecola sp. 1036]|uniref:hypothetical protein n=1 Tax=Alteromonadaceae TaxID=72275 RepID=UPI003CFC7F1F
MSSFNGNKVVLLTLALLISVTFFVLGYLYAANTLSQQQNIIVQTEDMRQTQDAVINSKTQAQINHQKTDDINENAQGALAPDSQVTNDSDLLVMIERLSQTSDSENYEQYNQELKLIIQFLTEFPEQIDIAIEYLDSIPYYSKEFYLITNLLNRLPNQMGAIAMTELAKDYVARGDSRSQIKFLNLIQKTRGANDNPVLKQALLNLALYSARTRNIRLDAISYIQPYEIEETEKSILATELANMAENSATSDLDKLLPHLIRFSAPQNRSDIVIKYIQQDNPSNIRFTMLRSIQTGDITLSNRLRETLFNIAFNQDDHLSDNAKHLLMSKFDITHEEYQLLMQN